MLMTMRRLTRNLRRSLTSTEPTFADCISSNHLDSASEADTPCWLRRAELAAAQGVLQTYQMCRVGVVAPGSSSASRLSAGLGHAAHHGADGAAYSGHCKSSRPAPRTRPWAHDDESVTSHRWTHLRRSGCVVRPWLLRSLFRSCSLTAMRLACSTAAQPLEAAVDVRAFPAPALNPRRATSPARQHAARVRKGPTAHACCRSLRSFTQVALLWGSSADACAAPAAARPR